MYETLISHITLYSGRKRNGFFVEVGGYDGETHSNTVLFELERNWTGMFMGKSSFLLPYENSIYYVINCLFILLFIHLLYF